MGQDTSVKKNAPGLAAGEGAAVAPSLAKALAADASFPPAWPANSATDRDVTAGPAGGTSSTQSVTPSHSAQMPQRVPSPFEAALSQAPMSMPPLPRSSQAVAGKSAAEAAAAFAPAVVTPVVPAVKGADEADSSQPRRAAKRRSRRGRHAGGLRRQRQRSRRLIR